MFFLERITRQVDRNRIVYSILLVMIVSLQVAYRMLEDYLPSFIEMYAESIIWSVVLFLVFAFVFKTNSIIFVGGMTFIFAMGIEATKLYSLPNIIQIRETFMGGLILGREFLWSNFICYTIGILSSMIAEYNVHNLDFLFIDKI